MAKARHTPLSMDTPFSLAGNGSANHAGSGLEA